MGGSRRILIVDDEPGIRKLLSATFQRDGYGVRVASSGPEAMAICESETFDILLSDVRMPGGVNGHQLARWLVTRSPETRCVLMSGFDDCNCEGCGVSAQPCLLLGKPFPPKKAVELVNQVLEGTLSDAPVTTSALG
jgi:DNA-binding NtrC family response regulator